jgi:hypothetical protein
MSSLQSIHWLQSVGVLDVGRGREPRGREPRGREPPTAAASSAASSSSSSSDGRGRGPAASTAAITWARGGGGKKTAQANKVWRPVSISIPEVMPPARAPRRWVHVNWHPYADSVAFFVASDSKVGELFPRIAAWFRLPVAMINLLHAAVRLDKDTTWERLTGWDIEVSMDLTTVYQ